MIRVPPQDYDLDSLRGVVVDSPTYPRVNYTLERQLGAGGMSVAFFATLRSKVGETPCVIKLMQPSFVRSSPAQAAIAVEKEATALRRLNERVPPTPFVVRLLEFGVLPVLHGQTELSLPWLSIEYVHGGAEGTTLTKRVENSMLSTGYAFDPMRAARAVDCMAEGLGAIHDMAVIHRDIKPDNILCCGFDSGELFKITDFGIARPSGVAATFGGVVVGTPGYASPEQMGGDSQKIGPWTDVFGLATAIYFLLTGEDYFPIENVMQAFTIVRAPHRRSVLEARGLDTELRRRPDLCRHIDDVLARATAFDSQNRPQSARDLAALLMPALRTDSKPVHSARARIETILGASQASARRSWTVRHEHGEHRLIRHVAWNSDGTCLAVTDEGLAFWDGLSWVSMPSAGIPDPTGLTFIRQTGPNRWLVGSSGAMLLTLTADGVREVTQGMDSSMTIEHASGDLQDLAVVVAQSAGSPPMLYAIAARRWLKPLPLEGVANIAAISRLEDTRWLLAGRSTDGSGFAAIYDPLQWSISRFPSGSIQAFLASAGAPELGTGMIAGTAGTLVWIDDASIAWEQIAGGSTIAACAIDASRRGWAAAAGHLWMREPERPAHWELVWQDPSWIVPIISLYADLGIVRAMTADGGILEGRVERQTMVSQ